MCIDTSNGTLVSGRRLVRPSPSRARLSVSGDGCVGRRGRYGVARSRSASASGRLWLPWRLALNPLSRSV